MASLIVRKHNICYEDIPIVLQSVDCRMISLCLLSVLKRVAGLEAAFVGLDLVVHDGLIFRLCPLLSAWLRGSA